MQKSTCKGHTHTPSALTISMMWPPATCRHLHLLAKGLSLPTYTTGQNAQGLKTLAPLR